MTKKRLMALLLTAAMLLALTACGSKTEEAPSEPEKVEEAAPVESPEAEVQEETEAEPEPEEETPADPKANFPLFDEVTEFTIWTDSSPDLSDIIEDMSDYTIIREMEKLTNLRWDATMVSFTAKTEQFNLMVAAQEYTDVCNGADSYNGGTDQAVEDEFLISIKDLAEEHMPNLMSKMEEHPSLKSALITLEGNMCYFPKIYTQPSLPTAGMNVRMDWLEDLGIDAPKTYDDLYNMLTAFKTEKGADAALIIPAGGVPSSNSLIGGYGIGAGYYQVDGEVRYGLIQPEYKEYLTMLNKWYSEGLIWSDFYTQSTDRLMDFAPILTGRTGYWHGGVQDMSTLARQATDPNFKLGGLTEVSLDGSQSHLGEEPTMLDQNSWAITTACEDPVSVCKYVDYLYSDEGVLLANYGVEGETFEYDENGKPYLTEMVTNNPEYEYRIALNIFTCDRQTPVPYVIDQTKSLADYSAEQLQAMEAWELNSDYAYNLPSRGMNYTLEESNEMSLITTDLETYVEENIVLFILGDKPLDEFDEFVDQVKAMNIDRCVEITQESYDRYLENR